MKFAMQVLQAGPHKLIYLEVQPEMVASIARQAGFETKARDGQRNLQLDLSVPDRQGPLLLFDAADPGNLGWLPGSAASNSRSGPCRSGTLRSSCRLRWPSRALVSKPACRAMLATISGWTSR